MFADEAGVLPDRCRRGALHGFEVCLTVIGIQNDTALKGFEAKYPLSGV